MTEYHNNRTQRVPGTDEAILVVTRYSRRNENHIYFFALTVSLQHENIIMSCRIKLLQISGGKRERRIRPRHPTIISRSTNVIGGKTSNRDNNDNSHNRPKRNVKKY